jgi:hypothetical protein
MEDKEYSNLRVLEILQHHGEIMEIIKACPECSAHFRSKLKIKTSNSQKQKQDDEFRDE